MPGEYRRIRVYLYERQADPEARDSVRNAAQREFLAAQGIEHPGLLVPRELLDHYMTGAGAALDLPARLELVRQLAEAVRYAHDRRLVHRALSPRAIIVEPGQSGWSGAGVPNDGLKPEALIRRGAARFPGLPALPEGLDLARLLRDAGFDLRCSVTSYRSAEVAGSVRIGVVRGRAHPARALLPSVSS